MVQREKIECNCAHKCTVPNAKIYILMTEKDIHPLTTAEYPKKISKLSCTSEYEVVDEITAMKKIPLNMDAVGVETN
jgi:hypothetical protein